MPNLEQILEHVDLDHWQRPAHLLRLLSQLEELGLVFAPLSPKLLLRLGRTADQARYDHKVLVRLASRDRVLIRLRGSGRVPDAWHIADPRRWLHVPWITPRRDVLASLFLADPARNPVPLWGKSAGIRFSWGAIDPFLEELNRLGLSVNLRPSTEWDHPSTERLPRLSGDRSPLYGTEPPAFSQLHGGSIDPLLSLEAEGRKEAATQPSGKALEILAVAAKASGLQSIYGDPARRIATVVDSNPERFEKFLEVARQPARGPLGVAAALENAAAIPLASRDLDVELEKARRMLATWEEHGVEEELLEEKRETVRRLEAEVTEVLKSTNSSQS
jgi:hypothetical protein